MWPGVAIGAFLANLWTDASLISVVGITVGNTLEAAVGAYLLRRVRFHPTLDRLKDVSALFVLAGVLSTAIAATIGVASLWIDGQVGTGDLFSAWRVWWLGDMGGDLLVAPLILVCAAGLRFNRRPARVAEGAALASAVMAVAMVWLFADAAPSYIAFPLLIWAALRFSQQGAVLVSFALAGVSIVYTSAGLGPFMQGSPDGRLLLSQTFMGVAALTALTLAALTAQRRRAERALKAEQDKAEVRQRTKDLVQSNAELRRAVQELEQFGHVVSHDLSEPLRAIAGFAELLGDRYEGRLDERADGYIRYVVDGATRMKALIDALLAYSRAGGEEVNFADVDCQTLLHDAKKALSMVIDESSAVVTADSLPVVHADPVLLGEVFQNLLSNAVKFSNGGGCRVHVSAEREESAWRLSFRDQGIGLDPRHAERVFRVFKRVSGPGEYPGTGIGLAICKKVVESHGGDIWFERAEDSGSVFSFTLPDSAGMAS
jgi:signal transduction histidine kinase